MQYCIYWFASYFKNLNQTNMLLTHARHAIMARYKTYRLRNIKTKQIVYKTHGVGMHLDVSQGVDRRIFTGTLEWETISFFKKLIKPGMTVFDIGANVGYYSIVAASQLKGAGRVYAFEPAEIPFNRFKRTIEENKLRNIFLYQEGIAEKDGEIDFNFCHDDQHSSIGNAPMGKIIRTGTIKVVSIDSFCKRENIERIDILKMDTEGAEYLALKGALSILQSHTAPIIFCEYNKYVEKGYSYSLTDYENLLKYLGYLLFEIKNGKLLKFEPATSNATEIVCMKQADIDSHKNLISSSQTK